MEEQREVPQEVIDAQDEVNAQPEEWEYTYGFKHTCSCVSDMEQDNMGEVTECYAALADDALDTCERQQTALRRIASGSVPEPVIYAQEFVPLGIS